MKLTSIGLYSNNALIATLSFNEPNSQSPYIARQVTGLDADQIVQKFNRFSLADSVTPLYNVASGKREIVMRIVLNTAFTVGKTYSELRDDLYRAIASTRNGLVTLKFNNGLTTICEIAGFISKLESSHFTREPEVQLTITCRDNMFKAPARTTVATGSFPTVHTFSVTDSLSTAPHGLCYGIYVTDYSGHHSIADAATGETWKFLVSPPLTVTYLGVPAFHPGDIIHISSEINNKWAYVIHDSVRIDLSDRIAVGSSWPMLYPGENDFYVYNSGFGFTWNYMDYYANYWGI
jgi:hypothetical protein